MVTHAGVEGARKGRVAPAVLLLGNLAVSQALVRHVLLLFQPAGLSRLDPHLGCAHADRARTLPRVLGGFELAGCRSAVNAVASVA